MRLFVVLIAALVMGGCSTFAPSVDFPGESASSVRADERNDEVALERERARIRGVEQSQYYREDRQRETGNAEGSLFNPYTYSGLFEDRRARQVGDLLTIVIAENINSRQRNNTSVSRDDDISLTTPSFGFLFEAKPVNKAVSSSKDFSGEGETSAGNQFTGTIAVVVTDVMPSGNLRVKGERQIGTNREVETVKFYGLVNPETIRSGNRVVSTEVAEARIEYRGRGQIDSAQTMGWLSRFFLTVSPF